GWWNQITLDTKVIFVVTILVALIGIYLDLRRNRQKKRDEAAQRAATAIGFPFYIHSSQNLSALRELLIGRHHDTKYVTRLTPQQIDTLLTSKRLVLTGRTGLGKTRECFELILKLAEAEQVTVLYPREQMDAPTAYQDFPRKSVVLLIDEI